MGDAEDHEQHPCGPPSIAYPDRTGSDGELTIELDAPVVVFVTEVSVPVATS